jgi:hypothetical protein
MHVASRRSEHLPHGQLHAVVADTQRTLCGLGLGDGLVIVGHVTWETTHDDGRRCAVCAAGAKSLASIDPR